MLTNQPEISKDILLKMLKDMLLARSFEERVNEMFMMGKIHGTTHLAIGQEAMGAGVSNALGSEDWILPTHRGHGHCIAKSGNVKAIMAELCGKKDGTCMGIGGSMHIADIAAKNLGTSGIVGGTFPIAVGVALALKMQGIRAVVTCIFGDAANNQGTFHESLNLASIWKLPVLFVCENNLYGMSVPISYSMAVKDVATRAVSYNMPSKIIDGNNVLDVYQNIKEIAETIKSGSGPFLLECKTYRWLGHSKSDPRKYRSKEEEKMWKERCPIKFFKNYLTENNYIIEEEYNQICADVTAEIEEAVQYAENSPVVSLAEVEKLIYS
jgi:TPP-dependent pyruvate/acetoin dehydrogenase alpha subunit